MTLLQPIKFSTHILWLSLTFLHRNITQNVPVLSFRCMILMLSSQLILHKILCSVDKVNRTEICKLAMLIDGSAEAKIVACKLKQIPLKPSQSALFKDN